MLTLILGLFVSTTVSAGVVQVTSIYRDDSDADRELKVNGSGLIFLRDGRQFVFTASHVSQGHSTKVYSGDVELKILGRMLHAKSDLELLEVNGAAAASIKAEYKHGRIEFLEGNSRRRWLDSRNYVPLLDWINDPKLEIDNEFSSARASVFKLNATGNLLNADALVQPGTSGAPLLSRTPAEFDAREGLSKTPNGLTVVRALAIRRDRFFARSSFVPFAAMDELLTRYLSNKPPQKLKQWFARGAVLYRKARVHRELSGLSSATAGGTLTDVGNGVSMDGGDLATLSEDTPDSFLSKVSALMATENDPILYWSMPLAHPAKEEAIRFGTWFDMELYPMAQSGSILLGFHESNLPDLAGPLLARIGAEGIYETTTPAFLRIDYNSVSFKIPLGGEDRLEVDLNRTGFYCPRKICRDRFQPVLEVSSVKGRAYIVDLREFFFLDIANLDLDGLSGPSELPAEAMNVKVYEAVKESLRHPRVIYRPKKSHALEPLTVEQGQRRIVQW